MTITTKQFRELEGLYFHYSILKRRQLNDAERLEVKKNVEAAFESCDKLEVPFLAQNITLELARVRKNMDYYFIDLLKKNNIVVA